MNKVIDKGFRSCRFVSTIVKHPAHIATKKSTQDFVNYVEIIINKETRFINFSYEKLLILNQKIIYKSAQL